MLRRIAQVRGETLAALVVEVDAARQPRRPLASALRVTALLANQTKSFGTDQTG